MQSTSRQPENLKSISTHPNQKTISNTQKQPTDNIAAAGKVITHAKPIGFIIFQLALRFTMPMPKIAPTKICVLDTGKPSAEAAITTEAADSSAVKPDDGCNSAKSLPTV